MAQIYRTIQDQINVRGPTYVVKWSGNNRHCLAGGLDKEIRLYNPHLESDQCIQRYSGHQAAVHCIAISPHINESFVSGGADGRALVWDVLSGKVIQRLSAHQLRIKDICVNDELSVMATASQDSLVKLWDIRYKMRAYGQIQELSDATDSVSSVSMSRYMIAAASIDGHVRVYDIRRGQLDAFYIDGGDNSGIPCTKCIINQDQNAILVSSLDNSARLIDLASGDVLNLFTGHVNYEYKIDSCLINNESQVVCGSEDGRIVVYDMIDGTITSEVKVSQSQVLAIDVNQKNDLMVSTGTGSINLIKTLK
ncbi:hypothetical protein MP228_003734 [Amoeboaphelidium protococcarum]|nr:hypothetical protein MP228_003734 [Amoeboaphelidium protococcarum]